VNRLEECSITKDVGRIKFRIPEENTLYSHCRDNLKSYKFGISYVVFTQQRKATIDANRWVRECCRLESDATWLLKNGIGDETCLSCQ
jgi:hypothetical protein